MKFLVLLIALSLSEARQVRIIGGDTANAGQFPFAAAIYRTTSTGTYFCSGALYSNKWVITSGTCVNGATQFTIRLGSNHLSGDSNALLLSSDIYYLHPDFNATTLDNDIGLIEFRSAITFTDYISPVNVLPSTKLPDFSSVVTFGWGQISDEEGGLVNDLQYVHLTTLTNTECQAVYGSEITESMVCVSGNYNEGICKGDLGTPLIQYSGISDNVYHVGVASFISAGGCESSEPSGYTRIAPFAEWITNITQNAL